MRRGLKWEVKNDKRIRFWLDRWIEEVPIASMCTRQLLGSELQVKAEDLWEDESVEVVRGGQLFTAHISVEIGFDHFEYTWR